MHTIKPVCHSRENGNPDAVPVKTGNYTLKGTGFRIKCGMTVLTGLWIPAEVYPVLRYGAGMT
jgi:hypothetical protein